MALNDPIVDYFSIRTCLEVFTQGRTSSHACVHEEFTQIVAYTMVNFSYKLPLVILQACLGPSATYEATRGSEHNSVCFWLNYSRILTGALLQDVLTWRPLSTNVNTVDRVTLLTALSALMVLCQFPICLIH